ncbi:MAG: DNA double-strand break repair nuclease NurA [Candidatus Methanomethyliales bacterium]|nr:DNA double-strand break repair nuclease NurA [Candidatus Methanomethylicales archaeon]
MPNFLEDFAGVVGRKSEVLKGKIFKGKLNPLEEVFDEFVKLHWTCLSNLDEFQVNPSELDVLAVDSSVYTNLLSNGGIFYLIRSMAIRRDEIYKGIETDVIFSRDKMSRISEFITAKMELLEFKVALEALRDGFRGNAILLDGSLYGRAVHIPIETKVEEERDALIHYFEVYKELLNLCRESNVLLVGVSKESRSTFYRDYLLSLIFEEEIRRVDVEEEDKKLLKEIFFQILDVERVAFEKFAKLKEKYGDRLKTVELIFKELASSRPDYQLIINHVSNVGYMRPLLLGPTVRMIRRFREYKENPKQYVRKYFPHLTMEKDENFTQWAVKVLDGILQFPSFASFYILLDARDSPIRIDMPYYGRSMSDVGWPEPVEIDMRQMLKLMVTGYCGLEAYNLWLKNVDENVRLRRKVVDEIYFPYLEKVFGEKIIRGRGYRRVKYP